MHEVQTRIRFELLPCFTRTRWTFGNQRRLERLCEKLTCLPTHGSLPQTSHRYAKEDLLRRPEVYQLAERTGMPGERRRRRSLPVDFVKMPDRVGLAASLPDRSLRSLPDAGNGRAGISSSAARRSALVSGISTSAIDAPRSAASPTAPRILCGYG